MSEIMIGGLKIFWLFSHRGNLNWFFLIYGVSAWAWLGLLSCKWLNTIFFPEKLVWGAFQSHFSKNLTISAPILSPLITILLSNSPIFNPKVPNFFRGIWGRRIILDPLLVYTRSRNWNLAKIEPQKLTGTATVGKFHPIRSQFRFWLCNFVSKGTKLGVFEAAESF